MSAIYLRHYLSSVTHPDSTVNYIWMELGPHLNYSSCNIIAILIICFHWLTLFVIGLCFLSINNHGFHALFVCPLTLFHSELHHDRMSTHVKSYYIFFANLNVYHWWGFTWCVSKTFWFEIYAYNFKMKILNSLTILLLWFIKSQTLAKLYYWKTWSSWS